MQLQPNSNICQTSFKPQIPKNEITNALNFAGVPKRYQKASLADFADQRLQNLTWDSCGYFLAGKPGVGKTHLAAAMLISRLDHNHAKTVCKTTASGRMYEIPQGAIGWISVPELLTRIRSTFNSTAAESQEQIISKFAKIEILVLDDLGAEKITDWTASTLYDLISRREANMRDTIVTTNQDLNTIEAWEPRIASRLAGFGRVKLQEIDRRRKN